MEFIDHCFVICAYKESEYLESCIESLKAQTVSPDIKMVTSTPNDFIKNMAEKYHIPLIIREGKSSLKDDWNFAYNTAGTEWMTIAHQDDLYDCHYLEELSSVLIRYKDATIGITDYIPIKNGKIGPRDINSKMQRILRSPMKRKLLNNKRFWKIRSLSLGVSIKCPCVCYHRSILGPSIFTSDMKQCIDWDTFYQLANREGRFVVVDKPLLYYRIHDEATSKVLITNHLREKEDREMFEKFWPKWIAKILMKFYKKAYSTYDN
ncbi:MAG: glycosyltransferase [Lachnospiraceae bacterium]|nr:glycosyltransferase [Lachnospiraceae bacterium]